MRSSCSYVKRRSHSRPRRRTRASNSSAGASKQTISFGCITSRRNCSNCSRNRRQLFLGQPRPGEGRRLVEPEIAHHPAEKGDSPHLCEAPFGPFRRAPSEVVGDCPLFRLPDASQSNSRARWRRIRTPSARRDQPDRRRRRRAAAQSGCSTMSRAAIAAANRSAKSRLAGGDRAGDGHVGPRGVQMFQQSGDRPADCRVKHVAGHFGRRLEHEPPPRHARMRKHQARRVEHQLVVEQQVQIDGSRSPSFGALRPKLVSICSQTASNSCGPSEVSSRSAPLRKGGCPAGPPTGAVSRHALTANDVDLRHARQAERPPHPGSLAGLLGSIPDRSGRRGMAVCGWPDRRRPSAGRSRKKTAERPPYSHSESEKNAKALGGAVRAATIRRRLSFPAVCALPSFRKRHSPRTGRIVKPK